MSFNVMKYVEEGRLRNKKNFDTFEETRTFTIDSLISHLKDIQKDVDLLAKGIEHIKQYDFSYYGYSVGIYTYVIEEEDKEK